MGAWLLLLIPLGIVAWNLVAAQFFPFKRCPKCKGAKRVQGMGGFKICTRCDKDGKVRRWGAPERRG